MKRKHLKTLLYSSLFLGTAIVTSCTKDFDEMNAPWKDAQTADIKSLFNGVVASIELGAQEQATANTWIYPIAQLGTTVGNSGYSMQNASNELWENYYRALISIRLTEKMINESPDKAKYQNIQAMLTILKAYKTFKMTDVFGDIPYFEAGMADQGPTNYRPAFDNQKSIYESLLNDLKTAVANLSSSADQINIGTSESMLNSDIALWKKFGNSLRLRYALRMSDANGTVAATHVQEALTLPLLENIENIGLTPAVQNFTGEWREWSFHAGIYLRMGSTAWEMLSNNNNKDGSGIFDPRAKIFFETNAKNEWAPKPQNVAMSDGGEPYNRRRDDDWSNKGAGNLISNFNYYFGRDKNIPELIITAAEVYFLKAEAAAKGIGAAASLTTAKTEYENGVRSSINFWTTMAMKSVVWKENKPTSLPTSTQLNIILANPKVAFSTTLSTTNALKLIYTQRWLDNFRQPYEAWALTRQTDATPKSSVNNDLYEKEFGVIKRLNYADKEYQYNRDNTLEATKKEVNSTEWQKVKVWWDVK
ncbi:SusD/RagB family nutrient-binding outer membrane lipoprotein [Sphingobacterium sp. DR205]|uniref:SusD/RagB family nutrient-binding outer membrane lipoprotein n=1 Tax=Sphingobacterium sp. DR205 TaxID=2713573 RepID=UPI0013E4E165|nr:SusD/RagB family nutrient-binding outer membrane lipoprotein [Sphingobacterium sp. DR205]QIH32091.1 SusD/RagB family nutrient-binding outer membrane lipoprotein [Sphingobacterium sp. DR205]